jgi:hypothetical protein
MVKSWYSQLLIKNKLFRLNMKTPLALTLVSLFAAIHCSTGSAQTSPLLTDIGTGAPTPGPDDVYMVDESAVGEPPGINYYSNGSGAGGNPGQIFSTGSNPSGYTLTSVTVLTDGNGGDNITTTPQVWHLRIYQVSGTSNATLVATYSSENFTFFETDWLQWTNLGAGLLPNTQYGYTIQNGGDGWEQMGGEDTAAIGGLYTAGSAVLIPTAGGQLTAANNYPSSPGWQADFDVGLSPVQGIIANPPSFQTPGNVYPEPENVYSNSTAVSLEAGLVLGSGTLSYQWQTDGGTGGTLTNIPGATATNLTITASGIGTYSFDYVVNNGSVSATSAVVSLSVALPTEPAGLTDEGTNYVSSAYYPSISQLTGGGDGDGLNYYDNNPSHVGQTFTTGTNSQGYFLTSVQIMTDPASSEAGTGTAQPYYLYIYSVNTNTAKATLIQAYTNASFTLNLGDWLEWSGLHVQLASNTTYAYTFANNNPNSYFGLASSVTNNYFGGELCLISPVDGAVILAPTNNSGVFYLQFDAIGTSVPQPTASAPVPVPASGLVGTQFTLTETATGATPLYYYWLTDGGSGGAITNIPGNNSSNLVLNTTGWKAGVYSYQIIVSNSYATATSSIISLPIIQSAPVTNNAILADIGLNAPTPGANDIYQNVEFAGSGGPAGLNYYFDNANPPGQTFVTGTNPSGYVLNSVAIELAGDDTYVTPDFPTGGQGYIINIFRIYSDQSGQYGALYASYDSQTNFVISRGIDAGPENDKDWFQMSGLGLTLQPNATYAYTFGKAPGAAGYENLASVQGSPYVGGQPGGQAVLISPAGGQVTTSTAAGWNGTFDLGLSLAVPSVTITAQKLSGNQLELQWPQGTLLQSTSLNGPWTTNVNTSPYILAPSGPQMFYRVRVQ